MKRLLLSTAFMFLIVCCETERTQNIQLAAFNTQPEMIALRPEKNPRTDTDTGLNIAIFHFQNRTGDPALAWLENGISDLFETQFEKTPDLNILNMGDLLRTAANLKYESSDLFNLFAAMRTARTARADLLLSGNFYQKSDSLFIDVLLKNIHTGKELCNETVRGHGMDQLLAMIDTISAHIQENLPHRIR